eukprot:1211614-Pleurochrysis_carterae.AAC.1
MPVIAIDIGYAMLYTSNSVSARVATISCHRSRAKHHYMLHIYIYMLGNERDQLVRWNSLTCMVASSTAD